MLSIYAGRVAIVVLFAFAFSGTAWAEKRIALVIGNGAYEKVGELPNPPNDARLIAQTLQGLGFEVIQHIDTDQKTMKRAVSDFGDRLEAAGKDTVGLFFYAGHGIQVRDENFLVPVNADINRAKDVDIESVSINTVLDNMAFADNRLNIVILDACRNNPYKQGFRSASRGLAKIQATKGVLIAYATAPGDVAVDGAGANSPYSAALAAAMRRPGLPVEQAFKSVRVAVQKQTKDEQTPWESSSLTGDFFFVPGSEGAVAAPTTTTFDVNNTQEEIAYWQSIQSSENSKEFEAYLDRYGESGAFTVLARNRAKLLRTHEMDGTSPSKKRKLAGKEDEDAVAAALVKGRKMMLELAGSAKHVMGQKKVPFAKRIEKFRGLLGEVIAFKPMAKFVLGRYYEGASPDEWARFYATYKEMFLSGYEFTAGKNWTGKYEVEKIRAYGGDILITVRLDREQGSEPFRIAFRVRRYPESYFGFKIIDALVKGASLLVTQRSDFGPTLTKGGIPLLVDGLEKKFGKAVKAVEIPG
jgi:uncharacterized caspase-like protein/ABC-type transporter MlaC component